jgi:ADP-ribosylglycohydrolase
MLGMVIGDSLGSQVEFQTAAKIRSLHPNGVSELAHSPVWDTLAGQPTDDSELGLALARSLVRMGRYDAEDAAASYGRWYASGPFDCGHTTALAFSAAAWAPADKAAAAKANASRDSQSNGSLMRIAPIGIWARDPDEAAFRASEDSSLSHPHPVCRAACGAFAAAISAALSGADRRGMMDAALRIAGGSVVAAVLGKAAAGVPPADFQHQMGWVLIALQNAFFHLAAGTPLEPALVQTVGQGGDTDTNAAIAGALLGAADGRASLPVRWIMPVLTCRPDPGLHPARPRPDEYWPDDLLDLTEALLLNRAP